MKKSLLFSAAALMVFSSMSAELVWNAETIFNYDVENPVPGLDAGWTNLSVPGTARSATVSHFGVGYNGKILTTSHKEDAIIAIGANNEITKLIDLTGHTVIGEKWNGTAVTTDDAGNVIFNYCFTNAANSVLKWAVWNPKTKEITDIDIAALPAGVTGRLDDVAQFVGDAVSAEGAIGYATTANCGIVTMIHIKGDGTKPTSITATPCSTPLMGLKAMATGSFGSQFAMAVPRLSTVKEILAASEPAKMYYVPLGLPMNQDTKTGLFSSDQGMLGKFTDEGGWAPAGEYGNRYYGGVATFVLQGKRYIVRNYATTAFEESLPNPGYGTDPKVNEQWVYSKWKAVLNFGIFDAETKECVASWMGSRYANGFGSGTLTAEVVDDNTVNIYTYAATGSPEAVTGTVAGVYCAAVKFTLEEESEEPGGIQGKGTKENPYLIASKENLMEAYKLIPQDAESNMVYFEQTADIDLAGVENYQALNGWGGAYYGKFSYDGKNHIIRNFAPKDRKQVDNVDAYYCQTIFGVLSGEVKNLGIINCNLVGEKEYNQGLGILAGYAGHKKAKIGATVDNVFVTGTVKGVNYTGGMFGTSDAPIDPEDPNDPIVINVSNSYAVVNAEGVGFTGGIIGRLQTRMNISNSYAKATVSGGTTGLIAAGRNAAKIQVERVIAIGTGSALSGVPYVDDSKIREVTELDETTINQIQKIAAFSEKKMLDGYPTLNWLTEDQISGVEDVITDAIDNENAPVEYFNLQGVRVENPANGLYIKRQGNKVSKVIIR